MKILIMLVTFLFSSTFALAQDIVIFNASGKNITQLFVQDSKLDAKPNNLLDKPIGNKAGVKLSLDGDISSMDIAASQENDKAVVWENQNLSKANKITINDKMQLSFE